MLDRVAISVNISGNMVKNYSVDECRNSSSYVKVVCHFSHVPVTHSIHSDEQNGPHDVADLEPKTGKA